MEWAADSVNKSCRSTGARRPASSTAAPPQAAGRQSEARPPAAKDEGTVAAVSARRHTRPIIVSPCAPWWSGPVGGGRARHYAGDVIC